MCAVPDGEPGDWEYVRLDQLGAVLGRGDVFGLQLVDTAGANVLLRVTFSTGTVTLDFSAGCPTHPHIERCIDPSWALTNLHAIASALNFKPNEITIDSLGL